MSSATQRSDPPAPYCYWAFGELRPAGETLVEALGAVLDAMPYIRSTTLLATSLGQELRGRALLFPLSPGTVLVVGVSSLAEAARRLLAAPEGISGWHLHQLSAVRTPLHVLKPHMATRQYNVLARSEFASLEEVAAVPWGLWEELPHVGPSFLRALDQALAVVEDQSAVPTRSVGGTRPMADHGWSLRVSPDGRNATVRGPADLMITELSGNWVNLSVPADAAREDKTQPPVWTVELAEQVLLRTRPKGRAFLRALIDEGGTATADRLRELTGMSGLHHATMTLSNAAAQVLGKEHPEGLRWRHFFAARKRPGDRYGRVYDYNLPDELVPIFAQALTSIPVDQ